MKGIDTNILVYAFDLTNPAKRERSIEIVSDIENNPSEYIISIQVVGEFVNVAIRKIPNKEMAIEFILKLAAMVRTVNYDLDDIALASSHKHFWDALLAYTYRKAGCIEMITDNAKHMPRIKGLRYVNPYR